MTNSLPTCGAVGGMGPIAAIGFLQLVVDLTSNADTDQDHVKIVLEQDGTIPSRNPAIEAVVNVRRRNLDSSHPDAIAAKVLQDEIGLHLAANVKSLADRGVDYVVLLCNTVHFFAPYVHDVLQSYPNVQFLSIIELAADKVMNHYKANPGIGPCAILGQGGCLKSGLYQNALGARGIDFYTLPETEDEMQEGDEFTLADCVESIFMAKGNDLEGSAKLFGEILNSLKAKNITTVLLGCTEMNLIVTHDPTICKGMTFLDTTKTLAKAVAGIGKGEFSIEDAPNHV